MSVNHFTAEPIISSAFALCAAGIQQGAERLQEAFVTSLSRCSFRLLPFSSIRPGNAIPPLPERIEGDLLPIMNSS